MSRIDDLLNKVNPKSSIRPYTRKKKSRQVVMMERSWMEDIIRPNASIVTSADDCDPFIDHIQSRLEMLYGMKSESTKDTIRKLLGWKKGWFAVRNKYADAYTDSGSRRGPPAKELARKMAKREKDTETRKSMKGR